jgi:DNA-damage-inducible protein J
MKMAQISIRIDDTLKADADKLFGELGLSLSGAVNIFVRQAVRQKGLPFAVTTEPDPVYNPANIRWLEESIAQMKRGEVLHKTFDELESMTQ